MEKSKYAALDIFPCDGDLMVKVVGVFDSEKEVEDHGYIPAEIGKFVKVAEY